MPKLPVKIKPGTLPTTTDEVTQGVLDKLPEVDRRELMRGALGTLGDLSLAGKAVDVVAPALKSASKIEDFTPFDFFNLPSMKKLKYETYDDYAHENLFDDDAWQIFSDLLSKSELKAKNINYNNAREKLLADEKLLKDLADDDVMFEENFKGFFDGEIEEFLDGVTKFEDLDIDIQEGLRYLISDKKMTLPEIRKFILDPD
jgi:hypothetical protein